MKITKILLGLLMLMLVISASGCDKEQQAISDKSATEAASHVEKAVDSTMEVNIYFPNSDATRLIAVKRTIKTKADDTAKYRAAIEELLKGPEDSRLTAIVPKQAKLLGITVNGDTAKVNFDKALVTGFNGGSTGEEMLVGSIVNTLTEFPEIKKVQLVIDGKAVESIKGHMDTSRPLTRMNELLNK